MIKVKADYGNKGTIPLKIPYANKQPMYHLSVEREFEKGNIIELTDQLIAEIKPYIDAMLDKDFQQIASPPAESRIVGMSVPPNHRLNVIDGIIYPHVHEIVNPDKPNIPNLDEYALDGTRLHECINNFIKGGCNKESYGLSDGTDDTPTPVLKLDYRNHPFLEWYDNYSKDYGIEFVNVNIPIINFEKRYVGEGDCTGNFKGKFAIYDFKRTRNVTQQLADKYWEQMAGYAICLEKLPLYMVIVSPYNPPIWTDDVEVYVERLLKKRQKYKERFGV